ncbi:hypothetical protein PHYPSEUDO_014467 [Phytophthora pseudosyringae]|uniref:Uncharacterized protein n=1 Tax=Phytophthora pseudosyringae TaxID=221518 RepID=A0A8T1W3Y3_9STRA|nr:hypothetical protein PHYPSEUDO_014467 [Phytophthora pseudosyringae]
MARGQAGGAQSSAHADMKMFLRNRMWRDHWYVFLSVAVVVMALFGSAFLQFSTSQDHVYRLEVTDSALMERVFRSGEPWVVLCSGPDDVLPEVFDKVSPRLVGKSFVGVLDCKQKLPAGSGKSVLQRYSIKSSISPTVFTVANGEKPKQVFLDHLQSSKALAKHVKARTKKTMQQVQNSAQLEARCLSRSGCALFLRGQRFQPYEKQWIDKLMHKQRTLSFAWIDSTSLKLSLENMLPDARRGEHRMVFFRRQRDPDTRKKVLAAKAFRGAVFDAVSVGMFLDESAQADSLKPLGKSPKILHRKKKSQASQSSRGQEDRKRQPKRRRHKKHNTEEENDDAYYFPQHVEQDDDDDDSNVLDEVEEEVDILDLDDDGGDD